MSHLRVPSAGDPRDALVATLGSDFQAVIAPFKAEIEDLARRLRGDHHRAAMRLLVDRHGRRPTAMEQQLILAALAELGGGRSGTDDVLGRVAARLEMYCEAIPAAAESARARVAPRDPLASRNAATTST